jgi:hypothetical protein
VKIIIDECLPRKLKRELIGHESRTVQEGWSGVVNGSLLKLIGEADFDIFITMDRNMPHQQNLEHLPYAIMILQIHSNAIGSILPHVQEILEKIPGLTKGQLTFVPE